MLHFCHEELAAILAFLGMAPVGVAWLRSKLHRPTTCRHGDDHAHR